MKPAKNVLKPVHEKILTAIAKSLDALNMTEHLMIVGSLSDHVMGHREIELIGDVDVLLDTELCLKYWEFGEQLNEHGLISGFDVPDRPDTDWEFCCPTKASGRTFVVETDRKRWLTAWDNFQIMSKEICIDLKMRLSDFKQIENVERWVEAPRVRPTDESYLNEKAYKELRDNVESEEEDTIPSKDPHPEFGLHCNTEPSKKAREL